MKQWVKDIPISEMRIVTSKKVCYAQHHATQLVGSTGCSEEHSVDRMKKSAIEKLRVLIGADLTELEYLNAMVTYARAQHDKAEQYLHKQQVRFNEYNAKRNDREVAPWNDYQGNPIREGDTLIHPNGDEGGVLFYSEEQTDIDRWQVDYYAPIEDMPADLPRLCTQINNKNRGVVRS